MSTYGIKITGNAGQFILDSDDTSAEYLTVSSHGSISANSSISWNPTQEFLLVNLLRFDRGNYRKHAPLGLMACSEVVIYTPVLGSLG